MGLKAFQQRLKEIKMSKYDHEMYQSYALPVEQQVKMLKVVIENVQAKSKERDWVRHQTSGNLDDLKLIEGLVGEKTIYRRRTEKEPEIGTPQTKPKRLKLVVDVSGSMYRYVNSKLIYSDIFLQLLRLMKCQMFEMNIPKSAPFSNN